MFGYPLQKDPVEAPDVKIDSSIFIIAQNTNTNLSPRHYRNVIILARLTQPGKHMNEL